MVAVAFLVRVRFLPTIQYLWESTSKPILLLASHQITYPESQKSRTNWRTDVRDSSKKFKLWGIWECSLLPLYRTEQPLGEKQQTWTGKVGLDFHTILRIVLNKGTRAFLPFLLVMFSWQIFDHGSEGKYPLLYLEVNDCFSTFHTSWVTSGTKSYCLWLLGDEHALLVHYQAKEWWGRSNFFFLLSSITIFFRPISHITKTFSSLPLFTFFLFFSLSVSRICTYQTYIFD